MRSSILLAVVGLICVPMLNISTAHAQTRTWVSGTGDDLNPCSRTAPCKTFAGAISKTAAGGEIDCLDPGGFGAVTITKSITIDCAGTLGSILAAGTNGVNVNDSASGAPNTIQVVLRNISINGATTGLVGVNASSFKSLHLDNVIIMGFNSGSALGLNVAPSAGGPQRLVVSNSYFINNGTSLAGGGVQVRPTGAGIVTGVLSKVTMDN